MENMQKGNLNEILIREQFYNYTKSFIDLALNLSNELDFEKDDKSINDAFQRRLGRFS